MRETVSSGKIPYLKGLDVWKLKEMADKQQQKIESQQQLLVAKEQRLKYLRQKEQDTVVEQERFRILREKVEQHELKICKLKALRGQIGHNQVNNISLTLDLESIRALFSEKEKELSLAVAKVEELTKQLEELKQGRLHRNYGSPGFIELERLRQELMNRNKMNDEANIRIAQQKHILSQKQGEILRIDKRIAELQQRLHRKRILNQHLANQITATSLAKTHHGLNVNTNDIHMNIATVEPYQHLKPEQEEHDDFQNNFFLKQKAKEWDEFGLSKKDPKYQTLPSSVKLPVPILKQAKEVFSNGVHNTQNKDQPSIDKWRSDDSAGIIQIKEQPETKGSPVDNIPYSSLKIQAVPDNETDQLQTVNLSTVHQVGLIKPVHSVAPTTVFPVFQTVPIKNSSVNLFTLDSGAQDIMGKQIQSSLISQPSIYEKGANPKVLIKKPILPPKPSSDFKPMIPPRQSPALKIDGSLHFPDIDKAVESSGLKDESISPNYPSSLLILKADKKLPNDEITSNGIPNTNTILISKDTPCYNFRDDGFPVEKQERRLSNDETDKSRSNIAETAEYEKFHTDLGPPPDQIRHSKFPLYGDGNEFLNAANEQKATQQFDVPKGNLKGQNPIKTSVRRHVSFDPLALMLDASLEGELELVRKCVLQVSNPSASNDEGITALHNAVCAGHFDIVRFLVRYGCDVNAQDSDGWTPLHCAASCNNLQIIKYLVEHGACIFATTVSDLETAAEKCEAGEEGYDGCSEYLTSIQEKLGCMNNGMVYALYDYVAHNADELSFKEGSCLVILRKGDASEREWWWASMENQEGYVPRNLLGVSGPRRYQFI